MRTNDKQSQQLPNDGEAAPGLLGASASKVHKLTMMERLRGGLGVEALKFLTVGIAASAVHFVVATLLIEMAGWNGWQANAVGFFSGFPVSYLGHAHLTFGARRYQRTGAVTERSFGRFAVTVGCCFLLSQASVFIFVDLANLPHRFVLVGAIIAAAALSYLMNKFWSFKG